MREHAGCLASNRRSHQDEVSHVARIAGHACCAGLDLAARVGRSARCSPRLPRPVHRRGPEGAGSDDGCRPDRTVRSQGRAGHCPTRRARGHHRQPGRAGRPAHSRTTPLSYGSYLGSYFAAAYGSDLNLTDRAQARMNAGIADGWKPDVNSIYGAVRWYHRPKGPSGANPLLAVLWKPIIEHYFNPLLPSPKICCRCCELGKGTNRCRDSRVRDLQRKRPSAFGKSNLTQATSLGSVAGQHQQRLSGHWIEAAPPESRHSSAAPYAA